MRIVSEEASGVEGTAVDVSGKVSEGGPALPGGLKLDVPSGDGREGAALVGGELMVKVGMPALEGGVNEGAEAVGQGAEWDEELTGLSWVNEALGFGIKGDGGNDAVDVGMVLHLTPPSMENGGEAKLQMVG